MYPATEEERVRQTDGDTATTAGKPTRAAQCARRTRRHGVHGARRTHPANRVHVPSQPAGVTRNTRRRMNVAAQGRGLRK